MNPRNHLGAAGAAAIGLTTAGPVEVGDSGTSGLSRRTSSGLGGEPPKPGTFTYEESAGTVVEWTEAWAKHVAAD